MRKNNHRHKKPHGMNLVEAKAHEKAVFDALVNEKANELYNNRVKRLQQMFVDGAFIAANKVLKMGPGRCEKFGEEMISSINELAKIVVDDAKDDPNFEYAKVTIDRELKRICGEKFEPWEVRYKV